MYFHLGGSRIVMNDDLIGIFRFELAKERNNHNLFISRQNCDPLLSDRSKRSFVVTKSSIHFSPISSLTLANRVNSSV